MPCSCFANGCTNRQKPGVHLGFFHIPEKDKERRRLWLAKIGRKHVPKSTDRLCGAHFISGKPSKNHTDVDFVPTIFEHSTESPSKMEAKMHCHDRSVKRQCVADEQHAIIVKRRRTEEINQQTAAESLLDLSLQPSRYTDTATDPTPDALLEKYQQLSNESSSLYKELGRLQEENTTLHQSLSQQSFGVSSLKLQKDPDSVFQSHTGLSSVHLFDWIVDILREYISPRSYIIIENQILLVLMKLKMALKHEDLALRFQLDVRRISTVMNSVLPVMAKRLGFLIKWPDRETCMKKQPKVFKETYPRCKVIIDCTEVFIERPSNLSARAKTWSNYKHHNTMKVLIGITSFGAISFVSKCWGGRVSDKVLTQESGFLNLLEFGDQVLADRGFLIAEEVANACAELIIPYFTKGKKQLSQREVEISRQIARVRIHVERAIRRIKEFGILSGVFPISLIHHADNIMKICSALTNLQPPLVK